MADQQEDLNQVYYRRYYQFQGKRTWMEKIWADAFGDQFPAGLDHYGYITQHDLAAIMALIDLPAGSQLLDIGCGKGGPGLRIAEKLQLQLTGIDIIPEAVEQAQQFQSEFELAHPAQFKVGQFYDIPLPDQSMDCVISIDSLWATPDKIEALRHVKRVMKPGAKFIFTQWDLHAVDPLPFLAQSGLKFVSRTETPGWKEFQQKVYAGISQFQSELVAEMGSGADMLLYEAQASPAYLDLSVRRMYCYEFSA